MVSNVQKVLGAGAGLGLVSLALLVVSLLTPAYFNAYYVPTDACLVAEIGVTNAVWAPECSQNNIGGDSFTVPSEEFWPLFPLQVPTGAGNPLAQLAPAISVLAPFQNCTASVDGVFTYLEGSLATLDLVNFCTSVTQLYGDMGNTWNNKEFVDAYITANGNLGDYTAYLLIQAEAGTATADGVLGNVMSCIEKFIAKGEDGTPEDCCNKPFNPTFLLATAFNSVEPIPNRSVAVEACEDDNLDLETLKYSKTVIMAGVGAGAVALIASVIAIKLPLAAFLAALCHLGVVVCVLLALMKLAATPAAAAVTDEPCEADVACYARGTNLLLALVIMGLGVVTAIIEVVGAVMFMKSGESSAMVGKNDL